MWYENHEKVVALGCYMVGYELVETASELQYYYEKPWKWANEWKEFEESDEFPACWV